MLFKPGEIQPRWKYFHKDHPWRVIPAIGSSENIQELNWLQRIWLKIQYQPILKHEIIHHSFNWSTWTGLDLVWVLFYPKIVIYQSNRLNFCMNDFKLSGFDMLRFNFDVVTSLQVYWNRNLVIISDEQEVHESSF